MRKISGKNVCPPKQYLNGKDGTPITDPKHIANEHAAAFTDNSSSARYSARFQTIKAQDERARIDFTSHNTEVYNKPFRLRYLRRSILKAKPRAPGPDGIHNNLLKHLPEDILKTSKRSWTSSGSLVTFLLSGGQRRWSQSPNQTSTTRTHSVTDPLHWPVVYARSLNAWLTHALSGILKNMA